MTQACHAPACPDDATRRDATVTTRLADSSDAYIAHRDQIRGWLCLPWSEMPGTWLYRIYDANDGLLYIGASGHLGPRLNNHRLHKPWWPEVDRILAVMVGPEHEALAAERAAIRAEMPRYNVRSKPGARPRVAA